MKVSSYSASLGEDEVKINVQFATNDYEEGMAFRNLILTSFTTGKEIDGAVRTITPEKIFRCGNATTVIWKDGTKTTVKLMPGAEDSDYGAFTAALAKKIYGNNSKVMRYAGMVQRVKSKAEKKAEKKAKHKAESEETGGKKYVVTQYGQVAEWKGIETEGMGVGEKVIAYAKSVEDAKRKAISDFKRSLNAYIVYSNGKAESSQATVLAPFFGTWKESCLLDGAYFTFTFAKSQEEALAVLEINPAPKEGDKP